MGAFSASLALFWAYDAFRARPEPPRVSIRWSEAASGSAREALEARYRLAEPRHDTGQTWSYQLRDTSTDNIRALVQDPAIEDTHNINRAESRLAGDESPGPLYGPYWFLLWSTAIGVAVVMLVRWTPEDRLSRLGSSTARSAAAAIRAAGSVATRGIPELRAEALGLFRFFYAAFLFLALSRGRLVLEPGRIPDDGQLGWGWAGWLASRPDLMVVLERALLAALVLFAIGLCTRIAYLFFATGMTVWILVWIESQHSNAHTWLVTLFMIVCLIPVPWDAAFSLDETIRRWRGKGYGTALRGKSYGYAVWMPGLILGTVWASAAYAKLESGVGWILSGAVKYHWVIDAENAPVDWGLWIASRHWAAVLMSFCGVFLESVFILSVFVEPGRWRFMFASAGLALLVGFYLFHGVLWWTWWLAFLSFAIPWGSLFDVLDSRVPERTYTIDASTPAGRRAARFRHGRDWLNKVRFVEAHQAGSQDVHVLRNARAPSRLRGGLQPAHMLLIVLVCLHAMFRLPAGFGRFGSYSGTYASTDAFDSVNPLDPVDRAWVRYGTAAAVEVETGAAAEAILRLARDEALPPGLVGDLRNLVARHDVFGDAPRRVTLTREQRTFDWKNGRFNPPGQAVVLGTLDLDAMALVDE